MTGPTWRKAASSAANGACVETTTAAGGRVLVRDSKHPAGTVLVFGPAAWKALIDAARNGTLDLPEARP